MTREMVCNEKMYTMKDIEQMRIYASHEGIEIYSTDVVRSNGKIIVLVDSQPAVNFLRRFNFVGK